jgi:hypothetical protein
LDQRREPAGPFFYTGRLSEAPRIAARLARHYRQHPDSFLDMPFTKLLKHEALVEDVLREDDRMRARLARERERQEADG